MNQTTKLENIQGRKRKDNERRKRIPISLYPSELTSSLTTADDSFEFRPIKSLSILPSRPLKKKPNTDTKIQLNPASKTSPKSDIHRSISPLLYRASVL